MHYSAYSPTLSQENATPKPRIDKKVKRRRPKSPHRGATFVRKVLANLRDGATSAVMGTSVSKDQLPDADSKSVARARRRFPLWYEGLPDISAVKRRKPPQWRHLDDQTRAQYAHWALAELGDVHAFTLNLRPDIETQARRQRQPLDWLKRRVDHHLRAELGRHVNVLVVLEETEDRPRRLHLHGEIGIGPDEVERARRALRRAGGEWHQTRQYQCHTMPDPDSGWVGYLCKNFWKATPFMREFLKGSSLSVSFSGSVLAYSHAVSREARKLFDADRAELLRQKNQEALV